MARSRDGKYVFQMVGSDQMVMVNDDDGTEVLFPLHPNKIAETLTLLGEEPHEAYGIKLKNVKGETTYIDTEYAPEFAFWLGYYFQAGANLR